jgi:hypothetical protein
MRIRLSSHARLQAHRRGIPESIVAAVARRPEQVLRVGEIREVRQSRIDFPAYGKLFLVRVFVDRLADEELVVTVYRTSRLARYWSAR